MTTGTLELHILTADMLTTAIILVRAILTVYTEQNMSIQYSIPYLGKGKNNFDLSIEAIENISAN